MDQTRSKRIVDELTKRGAIKPCPRCGNAHFEMVAETNIHIQPDVNAMMVGGPVVPAVMVACRNCGYLSYHALAAIGMMPEVARAG